MFSRHKQHELKPRLAEGALKRNTFYHELNFVNAESSESKMFLTSSKQRRKWD